VRVLKHEMDRSLFMSSSDDVPGDYVQDVDECAIEEEDESAFVKGELAPEISK